MKIFSESSKDIQKYLDIIYGRESESSSEIQSMKIESVNYDVVGNTFIIDNGTRWIEVLKEEGEYYLVQCGLIEYSGDEIFHIGKNQMHKNIKSGDFILHEKENSYEDFLFETLSVNDGFNEFMEKINRYLLINYNLESDFLNADWKKMYEMGLTSDEAAEQALKDN